MNRIERPLINFRIDEFEEFFEINKLNKIELENLYKELSIRRTKKENSNKKINKKFEKIYDTVLSQLNSFEFFRFPTTDITVNEEGSKSTFPKVLKNESLLKTYGYAVGKKDGKLQHERMFILSNIYENEITSFAKKKHQDDIDDYGKPNSAQRLKKIADTIASITRSKKLEMVKTGKDYVQAISDWEDDLAKLKVKYYDGKYDYDFKFPTTD